MIRFIWLEGKRGVFFLEKLQQCHCHLVETRKPKLPSYYFLLNDQENVHNANILLH